MKQIVLIAFTLLFARTTQAALPRDKLLTKEGKLSATLTLKDGQDGFAGITRLIWTVRPMVCGIGQVSSTARCASLISGAN